MYLFERFFNWVRSLFQPRSEFRFDVTTLESLKVVAAREQRSPQEMAEILMEESLIREQRRDSDIAIWNSLSAREKEVCALVCLHYTSRQIAARLDISPETVKTHVHRILGKFSLPNRNALRRTLSDWDFSDWL